LPQTKLGPARAAYIVTLIAYLINRISSIASHQSHLINRISTIASQQSHLFNRISGHSHLAMPKARTQPVSPDARSFAQLWFATGGL